MAYEQPLAQDGPLSDTRAGGVVRLAEFVRGTGGRWTPGREWPYRLEPTPVVAGYDRPCEDGQNGLSSFVALGDTTLLAVERACLLGAAGMPAFNPVRLYELTLTGADDISGIDALAGRSPVAVRKRLVLDLADLARRFAGVARDRLEHRGHRARPARSERRAHGDARERRQLPRHADHDVPLARPGVTLANCNGVCHGHHLSRFW